MASIAIRLDPRHLDDPDTDIRYLLPELLAKRSSGAIMENGYDYVGEGPFLVLFLSAPEIETALDCVVDVIENVRILDNDFGRPR